MRFFQKQKTQNESTLKMLIDSGSRLLTLTKCALVNNFALRVQ